MRWNEERAWLTTHAPSVGAIAATSVLMLVPGSWLLVLLTPLSALGLEELLGSLHGPQPATLLAWDKLGHWCLFFVLTWLTHRSFRLRQQARSLTRTVVAIASYGGGIELLQSQLSWRSGEWADVGVDLVGALSYVMLNRWLESRRLQARGQ